MSKADVDRARHEGRLEGGRFMAATFAMVLKDKKYDRFDDDDLVQAWEDVHKLWEEVEEGRISFPDILHTLKEENGLIISI